MRVIVDVPSALGQLWAKARDPVATSEVRCLSCIVVDGLRYIGNILEVLMVSGSTEVIPVGSGGLSFIHLAVSSMS